MFRETLQKNEEQLGIISEYKTITANLSRRIEEAISAKAASKLSQVFVDAVLSCNGSCRQTLDENLPGWASKSAMNNDALATVTGAEEDEKEALKRRVCCALWQSYYQIIRLCY